MNPLPSRAAFLDRDGTIVRDTGYLSSPGAIELLPGVAAAIARLNSAGLPVVVITNQSGIARGLLTVADYLSVNARIAKLLGQCNARIDAVYHCPHHPDISGPCECRKPGSLLYRQAAAERNLDLAHSAYVGDRWRDVAPAATFGGLGILVPGNSTPEEDRRRAVAEAEVADSLGDAVDRILADPAPLDSR